MILQFVGSSPVSGSVLTVQSLEPASDSVSPPLSLPSPLLTLCVSLSLNNKYMLKNYKKNKIKTPPNTRMQAMRLTQFPHKQLIKETFSGEIEQLSDVNV